ncbi:MAG: DUF2156 domain-containing protein [Fuerstiella sp.]
MSSIVSIPAVFGDQNSGREGECLDSKRRSTADVRLSRRADLSPSESLRLEQHAFDFACVPESYDIAISDGHLLATDCGRGIASVIPNGRFWHIAGGLLASESLKPQMIRWLADVSNCQKKTLAVYNVSETDAAGFKAAGFVVNKFGEEPILNPKGLTWSGKQFEWVRRQTNFCLRAGLVVEEVCDAKSQRRLADELQEIMVDDLSGRTFDQPLKLLEGQLNPQNLNRRRLFVVKNADRIEGFLACSPIDSGRSWAFESYRKRKDAVRGATAFLFRSAIDQLGQEGCEQISLCLVPGRNVMDAAIEPGDRRIQWMMSMWFGRLDFMFNVQGQDHFKSRFRPRYVDRYLCVAPGSSVSSLMSFLKTTGATSASWKNMGKELWKTIRRKPAKK